MRTSWAIVKMTTWMKMRARSRCRSRDPVAHGKSPDRLAARERTVTEDSNGHEPPVANAGAGTILGQSDRDIA